MQTKEERNPAVAAVDPNTILSDDPTQVVVTGADGRIIDWATRRGFGEQAQKLAYPERPGFHRHWFNDEPERLNIAQNAGYTPVMDADGKPVSRVVDKTTGMRAYLHEIPEAWYKADLAAGTWKRADLVDDAVRRGAAPGAEGLGEALTPQKGFYGGIKLSRKAKG